MNIPERDRLRGIVAAGWCHTKNADKRMDPDLVEAIVSELLIAPAVPPMDKAKCEMCGGSGVIADGGNVFDGTRPKAIACPDCTPMDKAEGVCEICGGTGGVTSYMTGRDHWHPCPRGCAAEPRDEREAAINHVEARELALMTRSRSNLARCYLDIIDRPAGPSPEAVAVAGEFSASDAKILCDLFDTIGYDARAYLKGPVERLRALAAPSSPFQELGPSSFKGRVTRRSE